MRRPETHSHGQVEVDAPREAGYDFLVIAHVTACLTHSALRKPYVRQLRVPFRAPARAVRCEAI